MKRGGEAVLLDEWIRVGSECGGDYLWCELSRGRGLNDVGRGRKADGAVSLAIVAASLVDVGSERSAGY